MENGIGVSTTTGSTIEKLLTAARQIAIVLILTMSLSVRIIEAQVPPLSDSLHIFEHVGLNIFVPVIVTGPNGRAETVDFIVDSGTNRTTIDPSVATHLTLLPYRTSNNTTPSGTTRRYTTQVSQLCSLSQCQQNLEVLVDDLSVFSRGYGRPVGGLLAMDFLEKYTLFIDFPNSQIGFLTANASLRHFRKAKTVKMISEEKLALVEAVLPNGKAVRLIFDTGYDSLADALVYESSSGELSFVQTGESEIKDANGSYRVRTGQIQSLKIGEVYIAPASIELVHGSSAEQAKLDHAGMIGIFPFRAGVIAVDYPELKLLVLAQRKDRRDAKN